MSVNVAIVGATGAVGQEFLNVLAERNFPIRNLKLLASAKSAGKQVEFAGKTYTVWLRAASSLGGHFCAGRGVLDIGTAPVGNEAQRRRSLRRIPVTVVRAT